MRINPEYVDAVRQASTAEELKPLIQEAIKLEHATIPPYLCGYFTLKLGTNKEVGEIIRSVVIEEMLHMTIACNLLLAIGGKPSINSPDFVPSYPGGLPFGIGEMEDPDGKEEPLVIHLRKCSKELIENTFMNIEKPDEPIVIPDVQALMASSAELQFDTIAAFYHFLAEKIGELGDDIFLPDADQVVATKWFTDPKEMFAITDVESARRAIAVIVDQGEGTSKDPFDDQGVPAHYYRFAEIVHGRKLIHTGDPEKPYAYAGDPVTLTEVDVWNMDSDPAIARYKPGSLSERVAIQFSYSYTRALNALHEAFNGRPDALDDAMGIMYELRLLAQQVLSTPAEWADGNCKTAAQTGLSFEYRTTNT